jgi:hypothetical protein
MPSANKQWKASQHKDKNSSPPVAALLVGRLSIISAVIFFIINAYTNAIYTNLNTDVILNRPTRNAAKRKN